MTHRCFHPVSGWQVVTNGFVRFDDDELTWERERIAVRLKSQI